MRKLLFNTAMLTFHGGKALAVTQKWSLTSGDLTEKQE